jgi:hypothetical protein
MADSKQTRALIGTPSGHEAAWLLILYKDKMLLGRKIVEKVTLFFTQNAERGSHPSLLIYLKDM